MICLLYSVLYFQYSYTNRKRLSNKERYSIVDTDGQLFSSLERKHSQAISGFPCPISSYTILAQPHSGLTDQCQVMAQEPTANLTTEVRIYTASKLLPASATHCTVKCQDGPPIVGVPSRAGTQLLPVQSTQLKVRPAMLQQSQ